MFSIDFESPRFKSVMRSLQFAFLTAFVVVGTIILVYAGQGYDINRQTGEVIQNGLVLVNTAPSGAVVFIDDQPESDTTPGRFPLPQGNYELRLELDGYHAWHKQIAVAGSAVEWLYYPRLIPTELAASNVNALRDVEFAGQSRDGQTFLVRQTSREPTFNLMTLSGDSLTNDQLIRLPAGLLELQRGNNRLGEFSFEGWAADNRQVLLRHAVGSQVEYVLLDTQEPAESVNLTSVYDLDLRDVRFIDKRPEQLYALVNDDLRRLDLNADTISAPLVRDVDRYVLFEDRFVIFLRTDDDAGLQLGLLEDGAEQTEVLANLDGRASRYRIEFAGFDNEFHLGLLDRQRGRTTVFVDPHINPTSGDVDRVEQFIMPTEGARFLSFSRNGQYLLAQGSGTFFTHDFDRTRRHSFSLDVSLPSDYEAKWLDGNYLLAHDSEDMLYIFEFDGGNAHALIESNPEFDVFADGDIETLITFTPPAEAGRAFMQATSLIIE